MQLQLRESCNQVLKTDSFELLNRLVYHQRRAVRVIGTPWGSTGRTMRRTSNQHANVPTEGAFDKAARVSFTDKVQRVQNLSKRNLRASRSQKRIGGSGADLDLLRTTPAAILRASKGAGARNIL